MTLKAREVYHFKILQNSWVNVAEMAEEIKLLFGVWPMLGLGYIPVKEV